MMDQKLKRIKKYLKTKGHKVYSDSVLKGMPKEIIIERYRLLEHNYSSVNEHVDNLIIVNEFLSKKLENTGIKHENYADELLNKLNEEEAKRRKKYESD